MRLGALSEYVRKKRLDGFLVTDLTNISYLSGFVCSSAAVLVTKTKNFFLTDFRYKEALSAALKNRTPAASAEWDMVIDKAGRLKTLSHICRVAGVKTLGFEPSVTYDFFMRFSRSGIRLKPVQAVVENLRAIKDLEEITLLTEAIRRAEAAFLDIKPYIKSGSREYEIAARLEDRLKKRGCKKIPFDIIVASGNNSALPHARATGRRLSPGDLVVVDWGGEAGGYFSDMTRTLLVKAGDLSKKKEIYNTVLAANRAAIAAAANNAVAADIDGAARDLIKKAGYGEFFGHGTGHGVGLEVHELPHITWTKKDILRQNMVFTIEPGIYLPGIGGVRIEDMVLLKEKGCTTLTKLPKKLEII